MAENGAEINASNIHSSFYDRNAGDEDYDDERAPLAPAPPAPPAGPPRSTTPVRRRLPKLPTREEVAARRSQIEQSDAVNHGWSEQQAEQSRAQFEAADADSSGSLDKQEILKHFPYDKDFINQLWSVFDRDNSGTLDEHEWNVLFDLVKKHDIGLGEDDDDDLDDFWDEKHGTVVHEGKTECGKGKIFCVVSFLVVILVLSVAVIMYAMFYSVDELTTSCSADACKNGGFCTSVPGGMGHFSCVCASGYDGTVCENDIDECLSTPCYNGGSCHEGEIPLLGEIREIDYVGKADSFYCECRFAYDGSKCQVDFNECASVPCQNFGRCTHQQSYEAGVSENIVPAPGEYSCECSDRYEGEHCEVLIPTYEHQSCTSVPGGIVSCVCASGYDGTVCENDIDECLSTPCYNGGSCHEGEIPLLGEIREIDYVGKADSFYCECRFAYDGSKCQVDFNECASVPCQNFGRCTHQQSYEAGVSENIVPAPGEYSCECSDRYEGEHCEVLIPIRQQPRLTRAMALIIPCTDSSCLVPWQPAAVRAQLSISLGIDEAGISNVTVLENPNRQRDRVNFVLTTDQAADQRTLVIAMTTGGALPSGWQLDAADLTQCDYEASGNATVEGEGRPTNVVECIRAYGTLKTASEPDLYILEDVSGSFEDDKAILASISGELSDTMRLMFDAYSIGVGSFTDVGDFCFRNDRSLTANLSSSDLSGLMTTVTSMMDTRSGNPAAQGQCAGAVNADGETVLTAMNHVGTRQAELGFTSTDLRVVLVSTDDYFKLNEPGVDCSTLCNLNSSACTADCSGLGRYYQNTWSVPMRTAAQPDNYVNRPYRGGYGGFAAGPGYDLSCGQSSGLVADGAAFAGQNLGCDRTPSMAELRAALNLSGTPIIPLFGVAPSIRSIPDAPTYPGTQRLGLDPASPDYAIDVALENARLRTSFEELSEGLGYDSTTHVMDLDADSSNFIELVVLGLRRLIGDLPDECERGDQCVGVDPAVCPDCTDTSFYGPKLCGVCPIGIAKDLNGECTVVIDDCCSEPCGSHGLSCTDGFVSYTCTCTAGWAGENCEEDVDECTIAAAGGLAGPSSCHSLESTGGDRYGGICIESGDATNSSRVMPLTHADVPRVHYGAFRCVCADGFTASTAQFTDCSTDIDECVSDPCHNEGVCSESCAVRDIAGVCIDLMAGAGGFEGPLPSNTNMCQFPFTYEGLVYNSCSYADNMNVAWCPTSSGVDLSGNYIPGSTNWQNCQYDSNKDLSLLATYQCACAFGYSGSNCDIEIEDVCDSAPCGEHGLCQSPSLVAYSCTCMAGWAGENCEEDVDECTIAAAGGLAGPSSCHSLESTGGDRYGGICIESGDATNSSRVMPLTHADVPRVHYGAFRCVCADGFTASTAQFTDCSTDIDECVSDPCHNEGVCSESCAVRDIAGVCIDLMAGAGGFEGPLPSNTNMCQFPFTYEGLVYNSCSYADNMNVAWCPTSSGVDLSGNYIPGSTNWQNCQYDSNKDLSLLATYQCACAFGYSGSNCDIDFDECASAPCGEHGLCQKPSLVTYSCACTQGWTGDHCTVEPEPSYLWLVIVIVAGVILLVVLCILCIVKQKADNLIQFTVATLDRVDDQKEAYSLKMMKSRTVGDIMEEIDQTYQIPVEEQRLFLVGRAEADKEGITGEDKMLDPGMNIVEAGIYTGCEVKLLQVWSLSVKDTVTGVDYTYEQYPVLCMIERHVLLRAIMFMVEDITGVKFERQELRAPDGSLLSPKKSLPFYEQITNRCTLLLSYHNHCEEDFDQVAVVAPQAIKKNAQAITETANNEKKKMTANSVLSMAKMFQNQQVPGGSLSELQALATRRR